MRMSQSAWERTQFGLVDDFLELFLPPIQKFAVEADYPRSPATRPMVENLGTSIEFPEAKLVRLEQYWDAPSADEFERSLSDWPVVLAFELLEGFGHNGAASLSSIEFEGLKQLANAWGLHLACDFRRIFHKFELFSGGLDLATDLILVIRQIPARDLGEMIRAAATPAYVRASQIAAYQYALFEGDRATMLESQSVIQASDAEIQREMDWLFKGDSTAVIGRRTQRLTIEFVSALKEILASDAFRQRYLEMWPIFTRQMAWTVGYRLYQNLKQDPTRTSRLLEAMGRFGEIAAAMEQYRCNHGWQGDRDKATRLVWQAVAPSFLHASKTIKSTQTAEHKEHSVEQAQALRSTYLSGNLEDIHDDAAQERLIGTAQGLGDYTKRNRAIEVLTDGLLGKLRAYLKRAAENEEEDYSRKQRTEGNRVLTEAKHVEDLCRADLEEDKEQTDDNVLSQEKQKRQTSADPVAEEVEAKDAIRTWYGILTEQERKVMDLKVTTGNEQDVARMMGISHQRVSQLLSQARRKWSRFSP